MNNLLSAMGITQWRLRTAETETQSAEMQQITPKYRFVALASQLDQDLLSKIMSAINCPSSEAQILLINNPEELQSQHCSEIPTIIFGENLHSYGPRSAIRTVSLLDLAENLPAKKALWQELKRLS